MSDSQKIHPSQFPAGNHRVERYRGLKQRRQRSVSGTRPKHPALDRGGLDLILMG